MLSNHFTNHVPDLVVQYGQKLSTMDTGMTILLRIYSAAFTDSGSGCRSTSNAQGRVRWIFVYSQNRNGTVLKPVGTLTRECTGCLILGMFGVKY